MNEQLRQHLLNRAATPGMLSIRAKVDQFHAALVEHAGAMPPEVWHSFVMTVLEGGEGVPAPTEQDHPGADAVRELVAQVAVYGIFKLGEELEEIARREAEPA